MSDFQTAREALDFLASQITAEAACEGVPFSEVERKMLYYTEAGYLLPDMEEIEAEFDARYDQSEYEAKVSRLMEALYRRLRHESRSEWKSWNTAVKFLEGQNHYILVMVEHAKASKEAAWRKRPHIVKIAASVAEILLLGFVERRYEPIGRLMAIIGNLYRALSPNLQAALRSGLTLLAVVLVCLAISRYWGQISEMRARQGLRKRAFRRMAVNLQGRLGEVSPEGVRLADKDL